MPIVCSRLLLFVDIPLEGPELLAPVRLQLVEPRLKREHRLAPQPEHAQARIVGHALVGDEPGLEQDPQVPAHGGGGGTGSRRQLTGTPRSVAEQLDHPPPRGVGEGNEDASDLVTQSDNSYAKAESLSSADAAATFTAPGIESLVDREPRDDEGGGRVCPPPPGDCVGEQTEEQGDGEVRTELRL
jgi:hypothetical protein